MRMHSGIARAALGALLAVAISAHANTLRLESELGPQPRVNSIARLMSGLPPTAAEHKSFAQGDAWQKHSGAMMYSWQRVRESRVSAMTAWRDSAISPNCPLGKTLFYPFSGPDFFNAYWLFPGCETYVMFGLEHPGKVPDVDAMTERQREHLIEDVRKATADLFRRNYFITDNMTRQLSTPHLRGVVPLVMVSMALSDLEILRDIKGVTVEFRAPGSPVVRRMHYFSLDATDKGLAHYPEFVDYLKSLAPTTTLIKSASYLLHNELFRTMGRTIAEVSGVIVQDDTGLPYATLAKGWDLKLYGRYGVPIKPFGGAYQPELSKVWKAQQPGPLPFTFGYQYNDSRDERSHVMVARRVSAPATAGDAPAKRPPARGAEAESIIRAATPQPR
jgi:hypothetical protein